MERMKGRRAGRKGGEEEWKDERKAPNPPLPVFFPPGKHAFQHHAVESKGCKYSTSRYSTHSKPSYEQSLVFGNEGCGPLAFLRQAGFSEHVVESNGCKCPYASFRTGHTQMVEGGCTPIEKNYCKYSVLRYRMNRSNPGLLVGNLPCHPKPDKLA